MSNGEPDNKKSKRGPGMMTQEHKDALAQGRYEGRAVRDYLEALRENKPKRGRKRTAESVQRRLEAIEAELPDASAIDELRLIQERRDLTAELAGMGEGFDMESLEKAFIEVAASYSERLGINYATWREIGVEAGVLKAAGVARTA
jgi:hypothetical protein